MRQDSLDAQGSAWDWVLRWRMMIVLGLLILVVTLITEGRFASSGNLINVARRISFEALIAFGMTLVIITGGIDLSVGSVVAMAGVVGALVISAMPESAGWVPIGLGIGCAIGAGAFVGAANGVVVTRFAIPPFIVTLAAMLIARGLAFIFCDGQTVHELPVMLKFLGRGFLLGVIPIPVVIMGLGFVVTHILLTRSVFGRCVIAVGSNEEAARLSGIPVRRVKFAVYTVTGAISGLVGMLLTARLMSADPKMGETWELKVIAAVVVGGTSLFGGRGSIVGTLVGALIIGVLENALNLQGVQSFWQKVVLGSVILAAAMLDVALSKVGRR